MGTSNIERHRPSKTTLAEAGVRIEKCGHGQTCRAAATDFLSAYSLFAYSFPNFKKRRL